MLCRTRVGANRAAKVTYRLKGPNLKMEPRSKMWRIHYPGSSAQGWWGGENQAKEDFPWCIFKTQGFIWVQAVTFQNTEAKSFET